MAHIRMQRNDTVIDVEITDTTLVLTVLGLGAAAVAGTYFLTRNPRTLKQLARIAERRGARLVHHGVPLLPR